jgi:hypothetical protein
VPREVSFRRRAKYAFQPLALLLILVMSFAGAAGRVDAGSSSDLTVDGVWLEDASQPGQPVSQISPGQSFLIVVTIKNIGQETAPGFYLDVYYDSDYGRGGPDDILAGEVQTWYVGPLTAQDGTHTTRWVVDPDNLIAELDESNNQKEYAFTIGQQTTTTTTTTSISTATSTTSSSTTTTTTESTSSSTFSQYTITVAARSSDGSVLGGLQVSLGSQNKTTDASGSVQFSVPAGTYTMNLQSSLGGDSGVRYVFVQWSDGDTANPKSIAISSSATYDARYKTQYQLAMQANPRSIGTTNPSVGTYWYDSGSSVTISATANPGYTFSSWSGSGSGSYTGSANPSSVTMNGPITETGNFAQYVAVTFQLSNVTSDASGIVITIDGTGGTYPQFPQSLSWIQGSTHTISASSPVSCGAGCQYVWLSWSDSGAQSHQITAPSAPITYTASFKKQYQLTISANPPIGGSTSPAVGSYWYDSGQTVSIQTSPASGYMFNSWTGSGSGSYTGTTNPASATMNGPVSETATFSPAIISGSIVSVSDSPDPVARGQSVIFTVAIKNTGNAAWSSAMITIKIYRASGTLLATPTISVMNIQPGVGYTYNISWKVPPNAQKGVLRYEVYLNYGSILIGGDTSPSNTITMK